MAGAAEHTGADVLVEVPRDVLDHEADLGDRTLQLHGSAGPSRAEREEHVAADVVERLGGAREEERRSRGRVGRIGEDGVERADELRRQRLPEVVLDAADRERRFGELAREEGDERGIDVHDREVGDRRARPVVADQQPDRERGQIVVAEQEDAAADEGAGLVDGQEALELRVDRAVALVELEPGGRPTPDCPRELAHERREPGRDDDSAPAAGRARSCSSRGEGRRRRRARGRQASTESVAPPRRSRASGARRRRRRRSAPAARPPG